MHSSTSMLTWNACPEKQNKKENTVQSLFLAPGKSQKSIIHVVPQKRTQYPCSHQLHSTFKGAMKAQDSITVRQVTLALVPLCTPVRVLRALNIALYKGHQDTLLGKLKSAFVQSWKTAMWS